MKLKAILDTIEGLPEQVAALYTKRADGKFVLDIEGEVPGQVSKAKLDEFRENNIELLKKIQALEEKQLSDNDAEELRRLKAEQQKLKDKELIDAGKIEELLASRTAAMQKDFQVKYDALARKNTELETGLTSYSQKLASVLIDAEISKSISEVGQIRKGALVDIVNRAKTQWTFKNDALVALDNDGNQIYSKDGKSPLSMQEWCQGLAESAPYFFESSQGSGAPGNSSNGNGGSSRVIQAGDNKAFISNLEAIAKGAVTVA